MRSGAAGWPARNARAGIAARDDSRHHATRIAEHIDHLRTFLYARAGIACPPE